MRKRVFLPGVRNTTDEIVIVAQASVGNRET